MSSKGLGREPQLVNNSARPVNCISDRSDDPGASRYGSFINYYEFNPPKERLDLLFPKKLLDQIDISSDCDKTLACLDVGCNSGVSRCYSIKYCSYYSIIVMFGLSCNSVQQLYFSKKDP